MVRRFRLVDATNRYLTAAAPWEHARAGRRARAAAVVRTALEALHAIARELAPFLPATSDELRSRLRAPPLEAEAGWGGLTSGTPLARVGPLFARIGAKAPGSLRTLSRRP